MKKFFVSIAGIALAFSIGTSALATNTLSGWTPSVTLSSLYGSKYFGSCSIATASPKPVVQTDLFVSFQNGTYIDLWNSTSVEEKFNKTFGTEQDIAVGWAGPLSVFGVEGVMSDVVVDIGVAYFDEPGLEHLGAGDTLSSHVTVSKHYKIVDVFVGLENYVTMPGSAVSGGNLFRVGACKSVTLFKVLSANTSLAVVYDDGEFGNSTGFFLRGYSQLSWKITDHLSAIAPKVIYGVPLSIHDNRKTDGSILGGLAYQF